MVCISGPSHKYSAIHSGREQKLWGKMTLKHKEDDDRSVRKSQSKRGSFWRTNCRSEENQKAERGNRTCCQRQREAKWPSLKILNSDTVVQMTAQEKGQDAGQTPPRHRHAPVAWIPQIPQINVHPEASKWPPSSPFPPLAKHLFRSQCQQLPCWPDVGRANLQSRHPSIHFLFSFLLKQT